MLGKFWRWGKSLVCRHKWKADGTGWVNFCPKCGRYDHMMHGSGWDDPGAKPKEKVDNVRDSK